MVTRRLSRHKTTSGHTIAECLLAIAILLPVVALVSKIGLQTQRSLRESVLAASVKLDLINAREVIGTWAFDEVTAANIQSLTHSLNPDLQDSPREWLAIIEEVQSPKPSKRVSISLLWTPPRSSTKHEIGPLTFWVIKP